MNMNKKEIKEKVVEMEKVVARKKLVYVHKRTRAATAEVMGFSFAFC